MILAIHVHTVVGMETALFSVPFRTHVCAFPRFVLLVLALLYS